MKRHLAGLVAMGFMFGAGNGAYAQQMGEAKEIAGNYYAGLSAGVIVPEDTSVTASGSLAGHAISGSGHYSFNTGAAVTGFAGYRYNKYLAAEGELGYAGFDIDSLSGNITIAGLGSSGGTYSVNGHVDSFLGFANAIITPMGRGRWSPYLGGGIGFANSDTTINSISGGGTTSAVNSSNSETDFAANAILGFDYALNDRFSLGGRYRYVWVNSGNTNTASGASVTTGDFTAHAITATASYHF